MFEEQIKALINTTFNQMKIQFVSEVAIYQDKIKNEIESAFQTIKTKEDEIKNIKSDLDSLQEHISERALKQTDNIESYIKEASTTISNITEQSIQFIDSNQKIINDSIKKIENKQNEIEGKIKTIIETEFSELLKNNQDVLGKMMFQYLIKSIFKKNKK